MRACVLDSMFRLEAVSVCSLGEEAAARLLALREAGTSPFGTTPHEGNAWLLVREELNSAESKLIEALGSESPGSRLYPCTGEMLGVVRQFQGVSYRAVRRSGFQEVLIALPPDALVALGLCQVADEFDPLLRATESPRQQVEAVLSVYLKDVCPKLPGGSAFPRIAVARRLLSYTLPVLGRFGFSLLPAEACEVTLAEVASELAGILEPMHLISQEGYAQAATALLSAIERRCCPGLFSPIRDEALPHLVVAIFEAADVLTTLGDLGERRWLAALERVRGWEQGLLSERTLTRDRTSRAELLAACRQDASLEVLQALAKLTHVLGYCIANGSSGSPPLPGDFWQRDVGQGYSAWALGRRVLRSSWFEHREALRAWAERSREEIRLVLALLEEALWAQADPEARQEHIISAYEQVQRVRAQVFGERGVAL
jgi:hypothetical protein